MKDRLYLYPQMKRFKNQKRIEKTVRRDLVRPTSILESKDQSLPIKNKKLIKETNQKPGIPYSLRYLTPALKKDVEQIKEKSKEEQSSSYNILVRHV